MTLDTRIDFNIGATLQAMLDLNASARVSLSADRTYLLPNGTGESQADLLWFDTRTVGVGANDDLDLAGGSLVDGLGNALTFARVKSLVVIADPVNEDVIHVGGAANAFASWLGNVNDIAVVRPGGVLWIAATDATAYVVTAGTGDILRVSNPTAITPVNYDIIIVGASA